jgi:endonuclease/exonuclease/phosphatase (EEP) superfamily protein YafD
MVAAGLHERGKKLLFILTIVYFLVLACWYLCWLFFQDMLLVLFIVNAMAVYLFLPLPLVPVVAIWTKRPLFLGGVAVAGVLWAYLCGPLFVSGSSVTAGQPEKPAVTVMTYNVLNFNIHNDALVEALRRSDADIIGLQELSFDNAEAIREKLTEEYPYQHLQPRSGALGMGVISRLPLEVRHQTLQDDAWVGSPIIADVHAASLTASVEDRERQAILLREFSEQQEAPVIMLGDFNATSTNRAYEILSEQMDDAWRTAGEGFGHTFPGASGSTTPGSNRPDPLGIPVPKWLIRIDYVFYSQDWDAVKARIGPWDGGSDHRPVIATLILRD